jgi:hypothetical protein
MIGSSPPTSGMTASNRRTIGPPPASGLSSSLAPIPVVDVRDGGTLRHAREDPERARALRDTIVAWLPSFTRPLVPTLDGMARRWLMRSQSPYVEEVSAIADLLGLPGVWFLNGSYQWCCTALAREEDGAPWLARTLDWQFPGLAWVVPPVLNACTRIAVEACPARGILRAVGYELAAGRDVPEPVTLPCGVGRDEVAASGH